MKTTRLVTAAVLLTVLLVACAPIFAHHGNANYDTNKTTTYKATVTQWLWANPHCILYFDVTDDKGQITHWASETGPPISILERGWSREAIHAGDEVMIVQINSKAGAPVGRILSVTMPSGKKYVNMEAPAQRQQGQSGQQAQ